MCTVECVATVPTPCASGAGPRCALPHVATCWTGSSTATISNSSSPPLPLQSTGLVVLQSDRREPSSRVKYEPRRAALRACALAPARPKPMSPCDAPVCRSFDLKCVPIIAHVKIITAAAIAATMWTRWAPSVVATAEAFSVAVVCEILVLAVGPATVCLGMMGAMIIGWVGGGASCVPVVPAVLQTCKRLSIPHPSPTVTSLVHHVPHGPSPIVDPRW